MIVPTPLLDLPAPWSRLDSDPRTELEPSAAARQVALEVLDRCLEGAGQLPETDPEEAFPEWITVAWGLWSSVFADECGSFDGFRLEPIVEYFSKQDPELDDELVRRYARAWLREQALSLARTAEHWLTEPLWQSPDPEIVRSLNRILEKHWRANWLMSSSLLWTVWSHAPEGSQAILREIAESPDAHPKLVERAHDLLTRS
jgi:hypothetical protein